MDSFPGAPVRTGPRVQDFAPRVSSASLVEARVSGLGSVPPPAPLRGRLLQKGPLFTRALTGWKFELRQGQPGSPWPPSFHSRAPAREVKAGLRGQALPPASGPAPHTLPDLPGLFPCRAQAPGNSATAGGIEDCARREKGVLGATPKRSEEKSPPCSFRSTPATLSGQALGLGGPGAHHPAPHCFPSHPPLACANDTEPILQVGVCAQKTYCRRRPASAGDGQTLQPHAQSQQKQDLALHLGGCPSVGDAGHRAERGQSSRALSPRRQQAGAAVWRGASHPLRGGWGARLDRFPGGGGGGGGENESDTVSTPRLLM